MKNKKSKLLKISSAFIAVIMLFSVFACAPFSVSAASTEDEGAFTYTIDDDGYAWITGTTVYKTHVEIPEKINGHTVIGIAANAFEGDIYINVIDIPESVEFIGYEAFKSCRHLYTINVSDNIFMIGGDAFAETAFYNDINKWTNGVLYLDKYAIKARNYAKGISLKSDTIGIACEMAAFCSDLTAFTIPNSVKYIGYYAAFGCPKMPSITIPKSVEFIGGLAFGYKMNNDGSEVVKVNNFKIKSIRGSIAEEYADAYDLQFVDGGNASSVKLNRAELTLGVGESYGLLNTVTPSVAYGACKWSSSNTDVAAVNNDGKVTAKKSGTATISLKSQNGITANCKVTVKAAPSSIKVSTSNLTLGAGEEFIISESTNSGSYAWKFNWSSSNTKVATVTKTSGNKAKIVAKGTGTADITVKTYNGKTATCKVTVKSAPTSVTLSNSSITLGKGETFIISQNSNSGSYAKNFTWSSSNSNVATIEKTSGNKAKITAKSNGTATITFKTYNGITATCKVTVKNAPSSVKTNPTSVTLGVGESYTVSESTNSGSYANAENLKWSSTNTSVATVTKGSGNKAQIVARGVGTAYVKITLYNGKTAQCKVTVKPAPTSVKLSTPELTLNTGDEFVISESTNSGSYANSANLKWESSDSNIATVTKIEANKAKITAKGTGVAEIRLTTYNGTVSYCTVYVNTTKDEIPKDDVQVESSPMILEDETEIVKETIPSEIKE
ncbi:Ig-like domain-containing protein [Ruminococcus sp.]|uniref:Ig-like domain-containing protein n=1 Tax=Ruminococcus sp. TaxID=41978 RepID=UPI003F01340F